MNQGIKSAMQRLSCLVLIAIMLNLSFYPAFAQDIPPSSATQTGQDPAAGLPSGVNTPKTVNFACSSPSTESYPGENVLTPEEAAKLKRATEVENKGLSIDNINSGRGQNPDRDTLENNVIVQETDGGQAVVNELPNGKVDTGEISQWFNKWFSGPFAFGVSLDDTIRIGQCRNLSALEAEQRGCPLTDIQLSYRNSGEGISTNFKNVWNDLKDWLTPEALSDKTGQYTPAQLEQTKINIASQTDLNSLQAKYVQREVKQIPNSVLTEEFKANMATTGSDSGSLISIYSMFDKYFNSWFSTEMVVSTFGPTLFGQAKKYAGWLKRRGWAWDTTDSKFMQWFRSTFYDPEGLLGEARLKRMVTRTDKYGFGEAWTKGIEGTGDWDSGYAFAKGGSWRKNMNEWTKPGGYLDEMTDPVQRGEFFNQIEDLRAYAHTNKAIAVNAANNYKQAVKQFGEASPQAKAALLDQGSTQARLMLAADGTWLRFDATELWLKEESAGLYDKAIRFKGTDVFHTTVGDSKAMAQVQFAFAKDPVNGWAASDFPLTTQGGFLEIYKVSPKGEFIEEVPVEDLTKNFSRYTQKAAMTEKGEMIHIDDVTVNYIAKESPTGKVKIYKANWELDHLETPELYAKRLTSIRANRLTGTMPDNIDRLYNTLIEKNFAGQSRRYYNMLDKVFMQDQDVLKNYLGTVGGAAKWTLMPYLYWEGKRGFGFEAISAFQLPDTWKSVTLYVDDEKIFDDAFIDIFAQAGSDEGEIFVQVLDKLPWKMVLNYVSEKFNPVDNAYKQITTPMSGWRRTVENVAYFTSTRNDCATCGTALVPIVTSQEALAELNDKGRGQAVISFNANQDMKSYFVEDILNDSTKQDGTTLIAFGHHTDITGEVVQKTGQEAAPIDLIEAQKNNETCADAVKDLGMGFLGKDPQRVAAILAFGESAGYFVFFWSGLIGSVLQQTLIAPKLQGCVDDIDGYFVHMFAAYNPKAKGTETPNQAASKNAGGIIQSINDIVKGTKQTQVPAISTGNDKPPKDEQGQAYTPAQYTGNKDNRPQYTRPLEETKETQNIFDMAKEKITGEAQALSDKAQAKALLQIDVQTKGESQGVAFFKKLFFFWFKGNTSPAVYDSQSKSLLEDSAKKVAVKVDKEAGTISVQKEGKPAETVVTSKDIVSLSGPDGRIPAEAIPQRIGRITLPTGPAFGLFEMDWKGNFMVLDQDTLACIKQNVEEQTGVPLATQNLTDAFGPLEAIVTDSYPSITASAAEKSIIANGSPREIAYGENARALVMSDMNTTLLNSRQIGVGKFMSVQFKNGVILYKPATTSTPAQLLIWLRTNEQSILKPSDVKGLKATLAGITNAETGCPEPAINLEAIPNLDAGDKSAITQRVENFNTSMEKMGPFQIFDTDRHRFMFYSEKTSATCNAADSGCCQDRVSIIDKKTGEVYDQAIVGGLQQTPTGVKFTTEDGKEHTLDFSADNGVPTVSYNDMAPETLTMARGPNGAFWYDPQTETWNPYNAQLLPLLEAFKTQGFDTRHRDDSSTSTIPGSNTMNVQVGGTAENPFNLPSIPTDPAAMLLFVLSLVGAICIARAGIERRFKR